LVRASESHFCNVKTSSAVLASAQYHGGGAEWKKTNLRESPGATLAVMNAMVLPWLDVFLQNVSHARVLLCVNQDCVGEFRRFKLEPPTQFALSRFSIEFGFDSWAYVCFNVTPVGPLLITNFHTLFWDALATEHLDRSTKIFGCVCVCRRAMKKDLVVHRDGLCFQWIVVVRLNRAMQQDAKSGGDVTLAERQQQRRRRLPAPTFALFLL
jgi:hypothetical protein